jgi:hypothetical protein
MLRLSLPFRRVKKKELLRMLAESSTEHVMLASVRASIERMAEEFVKDALADPVFRQQLKDEARRAARMIAESLRATREPEP